MLGLLSTVLHGTCSPRFSAHSHFVHSSFTHSAPLRSIVSGGSPFRIVEETSENGDELTVNKDTRTFSYGGTESKSVSVGQLNMALLLLVEPGAPGRRFPTQWLLDNGEWETQQAVHSCWKKLTAALKGSLPPLTVLTGVAGRGLG
jgi:hypothetical protein